MLLAESVAVLLVGLIIGLGASTLGARYFPVPRALTVGTAVTAAALTGVISHTAMDGQHPVLVVLISAAGSGLLVSVLARPDETARHGVHRRNHHRVV